MQVFEFVRYIITTFIDNLPWMLVEFVLDSFVEKADDEYGE